MKQLPSIIAVDGPAGSGKSSISFAIARQLGYLFADTGAFYRAITFLALEQSIDLTDEAALTELARQSNLDMTPDVADDGRQCTLLANGHDITSHLNTPQVDENVSRVAAIPGVRAALLDIQRAIAARGKVIMAGRDIGTVILPNADLKLFINASLDARAERRYRQRLAHGEAANLNTIRAGLHKRDEADTSRDVSPLARADEAIYLDTSSLTFDETVEAVRKLILEYDMQTQ